MGREQVVATASAKPLRFYGLLPNIGTRGEDPTLGHTAPPSVASLNLEDPFTFSRFCCVKHRVRSQLGQEAGNVSSCLKIHSLACQA